MSEEEQGLVGYWKLNGDCKDHSGKGNHGRNYGVDLELGEFDGRKSFIGIADAPSLHFGTGAFSISAWVYTEKHLDDVIGDVLSKYDSSRRKGIELGIKASAGGANSQGSDKHVYFGMENGKTSDWEDCGRPGEISNYVFALTAFDGKLYAGIPDTEDGQCLYHVCRYEGGGKWEDCGRLGDFKGKGAEALIVHNGALYAASGNYDWTRESEDSGYCHVHRYNGDKNWEDCGQPGNNLRIDCMATYKGKLYTGGNDATGGSHKCFVYEGGKEWRVCGEFPVQGWILGSMGVHDGRLHVGCPSIYAYDGEEWEELGVPVDCTQVHCLATYKGELYAGTWPKGKVAMHKGGKVWEDCGGLGDSIEVNALTVYNGKLYAGSIPRGEVYRYEGGREWTLMKRFLPSEGPEPAPPGSSLAWGPGDCKSWTRVTSLTIYNGKLFASIGSCTSSILDAPCDVRGKVYSMEAGKCISYDHDLGPGWKHIAAVREDCRLKLYINGELEEVSSPFEPKEYDVSTDEPLKIGSGGTDYFSGRIRELRIYDRAIDEQEVKKIHDESVTG